MSNLFDIYNEEIYLRNKLFQKITNFKYLAIIISDQYWNARFEISIRVPEKYLKYMINDKDYSVRMEVADRIDKKYLSLMMNDISYIVIDMVSKRLKENK